MGGVLVPTNDLLNRNLGVFIPPPPVLHPPISPKGKIVAEWSFNILRRRRFWRHRPA